MKLVCALTMFATQMRNEMTIAEVQLVGRHQHPTNDPLYDQ